jgi:hypothetical protein
MKLKERVNRSDQPPNGRPLLRKVPRSAGNENLPFSSRICGRILVSFSNPTKGSTK